MKNTSQLPLDAAIDQFAKRIVLRLDEGANALSYDVAEQLRAGRVQAVAERKRLKLSAVAETASVWTRLGNTVALGGGGRPAGWRMTLASGVPVLALVAGIMLMGASQDETGSAEVAEIDTALLADALPPSAYADPGFAQFLKTRASERN